MSKREKLVLVFILFLAFFLRFYKLSQNPPSLTWDEAAIGYNAYSILRTGRDEHGRFLPIDYFASFGDYKPPVAVYLTVLPTALFGLNDFAVRFPSAFFGSLTVLLTYYLVKEMFVLSRLRPTVRGGHSPTSEEKLRLEPRTSNLEPAIAALLLAVSPWHILLSRAAFEANIAAFFVVLATYFFIRAARNKGFYLLLSCFFYVISLYTFNTPRLFVPLFLIALSLLYKDKLLKIKKWVLAGILLGLLLSAPLLPHLFSPEGQLRFKEVNIFTNLDVVKTANQRIQAEGGNLLARVVHNRRIGYGLLFLNHYLDHFNPGYLFFHGDVNPKFSIQDVGQLYLIEAPLLILGTYFLFRWGKKTAWAVILWLFLGLVPAGTARETPHALRTLVTLPAWQIIIAFGIIGLYRSLAPKSQKKTLFVLMFLCFYALMFLCFLHNYFVHYPREFSREWQYGYKQMILSISEKGKKDSPFSEANQGLSFNDYDQVLVSSVYGRPYIYFLYYLGYSPLKYQKEAVREKNVFGQYSVKGFDKFLFGDLKNLISKTERKKLLLVGRPEEMPEKAESLKEIEFLNGERSFIISKIIQ